MLRRALALTVAVAVGVTGLLCGRDAAAQVGIGRGREAEVLRLIQPFQDEGPVAKTTLARIAIRPDHIAFVLREPTGATATLKLLPADPDPKRPPPRSSSPRRCCSARSPRTTTASFLPARWRPRVRRRARVPCSTPKPISARRG